MKIQLFRSLPGFPHKGIWTQANQILPDARRLKGHTIHPKKFGKIRPQISKYLPMPMFEFFITFFATSSLYTTSPERNVTSTKQNASVKCQSMMCPLKVYILSVTFDPETAEIRWKFSILLSLPHFPHKGNWTQANQILPHIRGLNGFTIHRKNFEKICPKKIRTHPKLKFLANTFLRLPHSTPHVSGTKRHIDKPKC